MNLSPINYQPMSVSQNMMRQNSVNFKGKEALLYQTKQTVQKLPEVLAKARAEAKAEIAANRTEIAKLNEALKSDPKNASIIHDIKSLEVKTLSAIRDFNSQLNDYMNGKYKYGKSGSNSYTILSDLYPYYLG